MHEIELTKVNRLLLAEAFRACKRVDYSIDCVVEGQMGRAFADSLSEPTVFCIATGPFRYFAGDPRSPGGLEMVREIEPYSLLQPAPPGWLDVWREVHGERLADFPRYSFSTESLSPAHLQALLDGSGYRDSIAPVTADLAQRIARQGEDYLEISDFDSPEDFEARGMGFAAMAGEEVVGTAYSSLVCSKGIEVSIFVGEKHRRQGAAAALASRLVLECLRRGLRPNWDAANPESCRLALKLGFKFVETYNAYYVERRDSAQA
jgi:GNAT superfamily N-acetyltransferase